MTHALPSRFGVISIYFTPRMALLGMLGLFSGLPLALTASTLTAWLADATVDRAAIGLFAAVGTPYALKFLWAPLLDGMRLPLLHRLLGRRRSWILLAQLGIVASLLLMSGFDPAQTAGMTALCAVLVAVCSATQDTAIDAYRVERLSPEEQGAGAAMATFGYRIGMLISGAGALALADSVGWHTTYMIMAAVMGAGCIITLLAKREAVSPLPEGEGMHPSVIRHSSLVTFFRESVIAPFADFMTRPYWLAVLAFVVLYKLGDAFMGVMFNPFLLDIGFSKTEIAQVVKVYGLMATLLGSFAGGAMLMRAGVYRTLMLCGGLNMLTNLLMIIQAQLGADIGFLAFSITAENFTGGMATTAFIAYLSGLCKRHYTATQYALLSSFAAFGRTWLSTPSGWVSQALGWEIFFAISCVISLPSLALLWWLEKKNRLSAQTARGLPAH